MNFNAVNYHGAIFWLHDQQLNAQSHWNLSGWCHSLLFYEICHRMSTRLKQTKMAPFVHNVVRPEQKPSCPPGVTLVLIPFLLHYNKETLEGNRWLLWQLYTALFVSVVLVRTAVINHRWIYRKDWFTQSMQSVFCTLQHHNGWLQESIESTENNHKSSCKF